MYELTPKIILTICLYLIAYAIDPMIWTHAYGCLLEPKYKSKRRFVGFFLGYYFIILCKQAIVFFFDTNISVFFFPVLCIYIIFISGKICKSTRKNRILLFIFLYIISAIVDGMAGICFSLFDISLDQFVTFGMFNAVLSFLVRGVNLIAYFYLKEFYKLLKKRNGRNYVIILAVIMFISTYIVSFVCLKSKNYNQAILCCIYSVQIAIVVFLGSYGVVLIHEQEIIKSKISFLNFSCQANEEVKQFRHDSRKHFEYMQGLLIRGEIQKLAEYLSSLNENVECYEKIFSCDNLVLSVIITNMQTKAAEQEIHLKLEIHATALPFTDIEMNSVISNILENALEAAVQTEKKEVKFVTEYVNPDEIAIFCANTCNPTLRSYSNDTKEIFTSKKNKSNHGYGLKIIKKMVERYKGSFIYWESEERDWFFIRVTVLTRMKLEQGENYNEYVEGINM